MLRQTLAHAGLTFPLLSHARMVTEITNQTENCPDFYSDHITDINKSGTSSLLMIKVEADLVVPDIHISIYIENAFYGDFSNASSVVYDLSPLDDWGTLFSHHLSLNNIITSSYLTVGKLDIDIFFNDQDFGRDIWEGLGTSGSGHYLSTDYTYSPAAIVPTAAWRFGTARKEQPV